MRPQGSKRRIKLADKWQNSAQHKIFGSNTLGGYAMFNAAFGKLHSKYDAFLAANINPDYPIDRYVMFTNCRAWLVIDEYSHELTDAALEEFTAHPGNRARLRFLLPDGHGSSAAIEVDFAFDANADKTVLRFKLHESGTASANAKLIIRPDLEDRINHSVTRACDGAEHRFRHSITALENGFDFQPSERKLSLRVSKGNFFHAPEWRYMVDLPAERYYGLPDKTDLFSPGYFSIPLEAGKAVMLIAAAKKADEEFSDLLKFPQDDETDLFPALPASALPGTLAIPALSRFMVKRDDLGSVIAGF
ncbi:MAG: glycogen debranching enzyme N-terminal domain-containing protein, partial [Lentisphaeria bacterium]|nr:glycogen debranching enzyme N-terminal domain-containing protein [Lentisphaeria bacterium]